MTAPVSQEIGKKTYEVSKEVEAVAAGVIRKESVLDVSEAKIGYMTIYPNISKTVAGRCIRVSRELNFFSGYDYIIQMSGELWDALDEQTKYLLTLHELMHIYIDYDKEGQPVFKMRDHDVQDFSFLIAKYGIDWINSVKESAVSVEDKDGTSNLRASDIKI